MLILALLGSLALFLYGMSLMSNSLQKLFGDNLAQLLPKISNNSITQLLSGLGLSAVSLSSRSVTVMVVSFVNAGLLSLRQAVGLIFGANIGITVSAWIIAFFAFKLGLEYLGFPFLIVGFFLMTSKKDLYKNLSELILGIALLFIAIKFMNQSIDKLDHLAYFTDFFASINSYTYLAIPIYLFLGVLISALFESSTVTIILTFILLNYGLIDFSQSIAIVLGANIGTSITANILALKANVQAKRAALIHLLLNTSGVAIAVLFFPILVNLLSWSESIYNLCAVHSLFNLSIACILIPFSSYIVNLLKHIIVEKEEKDTRLKFIGTTLLNTASLSIYQAFKEVDNFSSITYEGFSYVKLAVNEDDADKFEQYRKKLVEYENITDKMETSIANYLSQIMSSEITGDNSLKIKVLYRLISEMESLGDSCDNISRILNRERLHNRRFGKESIEKLNLLIDKVDLAFKQMNINIKRTLDGKLISIDNAYKAEEQINTLRNSLRDEVIQEIELQNGNYQSLNYFLDIISELEAMGDFMINISQTLFKLNKKAI